MAMETLTFGPRTQASLMVVDHSVTQDDLVDSLKKRLISSRSKLHAWVEEQKAVCDTVTNRYRADRRTLQDHIDTQAQSLLTWKLEKGLNLSGDGEGQSSDPDSQQQKQQLEEDLQASIHRLKEKVDTQQKELKDLKLEKKANEEASDKKLRLDESEHPTKERYEELLAIIEGYQDISGLSFEKAENERLRFFFKGLDKENRDRQFTFLLSTSDDDMYRVEDCEPSIPDVQLQELVDRLNESEDLGTFFQRIRSVWSTTLLEEN